MFRDDCTEPQTDLPTLWENARYVLNMMLGAFGGPDIIAGAMLLIARRRRELLDWLQPIEHLLRRLLYLEACAQAPALSNAKPRPRAARAKRTLTQDINYDDPAAWRVSFPALRRASRRRRPRRESTAPAPLAFSAYPLAARFEALLRVATNPEPYIKRMARRLRLRKPPPRALFQLPPRQRHGPCDAALGDAGAHTRATQPQFQSSA